MPKAKDAHAPYRDTFLVPALVTTVARLSADLAAAMGLEPAALEAEVDAVYGKGIGAIVIEAPTWLEGLRGLPDGCACCDPAYTPVYDQFEKSADVASRLVADALLQRLYGAAPVSAPQWAEALRKWLGRAEAPLAMVSLVASATMDLAVPPDRRRAPAADKLHQAFDRHARARDLATWPTVVQAIDGTWDPTRIAWPLLLAAEESVNAFDSALRAAEERERQAQAAAEESARAAAAAGSTRAAEAGEVALKAAEARIRELEEALAAARRDAADARVRASRAQTALDRLLNPVPDEPASDEGHAPADEPAPPPPPPEPEDPHPLRGERIYLFTNQEREGVRADQAAALEALGAEVTVYFNKSLRTRAPDSFPEDVIVVSDVAFAPHAKTDEIKKRAKRSGVRFFEGKLGTGSIGRAVAEYVRQQRQRAAEPRP
ncbi:MAG: hypothetical protein ACK53A_04460 [Gemmatimonadota bacterium]|jgi:hypothetical protein|nr:hypothetical protein [Gemmatimonadota bacterium]